MNSNINRISIIGGSGTGKTTLADILGRELNLPVIHIDGINYLPNWVERSKPDRDKIIKEYINQEKWIIDGTYRATLGSRLQRSDLVIYLDYSTFSQIKGIVSRRIKAGNKEKSEIKGCKEQLTIKFFMWVLKWRKNRRNEIIEIVSKYKDKNILIFKNRKELSNWYQKQFSKKLKDEVKRK